MKFEFNINIHSGPDNARLDHIDKTLKEMEIKIMATLTEVTTELADLKATSESEHQQAQVILDKVTALEAQVADLQAQLAAGTGATPEQLDEVLAQIREIKTGVSNIVP